MDAFIRREMCISCGLCAEMCPRVFAMDEDMIAIVTADKTPAEDLQCVQDAADACPVEAIGLK